MKPIYLAAVAVFLSACSGPPILTSGMDASNPAAPVPPVEYAPVTAGTVDYRPVEPKPWAGQNDGVAPKRPDAAR